MSSYDFIFWSPLLGAAAWFAVAGYLLAQQRYRTWTEVFFIALCVSTGSYGLVDFAFFNMDNLGGARWAATASLACLTLTVFFVFLYGVSLYRRFRRLLLVALVPVAFFLLTFYDYMFTNFTSLSGTGKPFVPDYNAPWLYAWIAVLVVLILPGLYGIFRTYLEVRRQVPHLARRILLTLVGFLIAVVVGSATNTYLAVSGNPAPPLFSTALAIPGVLIFFAVTPASSRGLNAAFLRRRRSEYDVKGAFLTFSDGTLIGSQIAPEEQMIDADSFSATLDVIQNFMRTSFPTLRGKWLKSIRHGDYTLVMERGKYAYLTLVVAGEENDQLRREMIEHLEAFEATNGPRLENWRGVAKDAEGVDAMLSALLA